MLGAVALFKYDGFAVPLLEKSGALFNSEGDAENYAFNRIAYAQEMNLSGDYDAARRLVEVADEIVNALDIQILKGYTLNELGRLAAHRGELDRAKEYHQAALVQRKSMGNRTGIAFTERDLGLVNSLQGNYKAAQTHYMKSIAIANDINMQYHIDQYGWELGNLAVARGEARGRELDLFKTAEALVCE